MAKNEEQILALEERVLLGERRTVQRQTGFTWLFPTPYVLPQTTLYPFEKQDPETSSGWQHAWLLKNHGGLKAFVNSGNISIRHELVSASSSYLFFGERRTFQWRTSSFALSYHVPATPNTGLTTHNLGLILALSSLLLLTTNQGFWKAQILNRSISVTLSCQV